MHLYPIKIEREINKEIYRENMIELKYKNKN